MTRHLRDMQVKQNGHQRLAVRSSSELLAIEQFRVLANKFDQLNRQRALRVMAVTSAIAGEGKTTIATNLAVVMARLFQKETLLIDADFRRPGVASRLKGDFSHGLAEVLRGKVTPADARWQMMEKLLTVLPLVKPEVDGALLLSHADGRARFLEATKGFEYVLIDAPPMLPLADNNLLADLVDGFLFVVKAERTPRRLIESAVKRLPKDKLIGFVLNNTRAFGRAAYDYHYYGPHSY
jgi:capsular exopolysaccharide synthesis family protein